MCARVLSAASSHLGTNHFAPKSCNIWAVLSKSSVCGFVWK
jgi:hypothetical protein